MIKAQALHQTWEAATHKILFSKEHLVISGWVVLCTKNQSFKQNSCLRCILKPHTDHLRKGEYVLEWVPCEDSLASIPCHCSSWSAQNWVESWWLLWIRQAVLWVKSPWTFWGRWSWYTGKLQELIQPGNTAELLHSLVYKYMQFPNFLSM